MTTSPNREYFAFCVFAMGDGIELGVGFWMSISEDEIIIKRISRLVYT